MNSIIDKNTKCFACGTLRGKNGTGKLGSDTKTCECSLTFVFTPEDNACICPGPFENSYVNSLGQCVSCASLASGNGTGLANIPASTCYCSDTFVYTENAGLPSCQCPSNFILLNGKCFSCASLRGQNSTGFVDTNAPSGSPACTCSKTFTFDPTSATCKCTNDNSYFSTSLLACISCTKTGNLTG